MSFGLPRWRSLCPKHWLLFLFSSFLSRHVAIVCYYKRYCDGVICCVIFFCWAQFLKSIIVSINMLMAKLATTNCARSVDFVWTTDHKRAVRDILNSAGCCIIKKYCLHHCNYLYFTLYILYDKLKWLVTYAVRRVSCGP